MNSLKIVLMTLTTTILPFHLSKNLLSVKNASVSENNAIKTMQTTLEEVKCPKNYLLKKRNWKMSS